MLSDRDYVAIAKQYCKDVTAGRIVACKWVKLACKRQTDDLKRKRKDGWIFKFDEEKATRVCAFVERMPHIKGPLAGQLINLEPWQIFILTTSFGWVKPDGTRRFRRVYIEVPRGNGKSALSSAIGLYCLTLDGEGGAEVYSLATTRDQARIVFGDAQAMARRTPKFRDRFGVDVNANSISVIDTASRFLPLASEASTLDGLNIHLGIIDELHAHKTRKVYDVVETGIGKRAQSLLWVITTAGTDRAGICFEVRNFVCKMLDKVFADDSQFGIIYTIDEDDDWTTEGALEKANPNWGVSVRPEVVGPLQQKAQALPSATNNFLTKHLNVWVTSHVAWMDMRAWDACADHSLKLENFTGRRAWLGLDLATKTDIASMAILLQDGDEWRLFCKHYLPEDAVFDGRNSQYQGWMRQGRLKVTPGAVTDYADIEADILEVCAGFDVQEIGYDPHQATYLVTRLAEQGLAQKLVEVRHTVLTMSEPMKHLEAMVLVKGLVHDGDPVLTWMASNVVAYRDAKDNVYPRKERDENKIDGIVATIMAISRAMAPPDEAKPTPFMHIL
jgi:phage terminase large subunit-like protein